MLHTVEDDLELCKEFKLTPAQLMFIKMLVRDPSYDDIEWKRKSRYLASEYQRAIGGLSAEEIADLVARDIIIDDNDIGQTILALYEINPKFAGNFSLKVYPMAAELQDRYPARFRGSNGQWFIGVTASAEEIAKDYYKAINNDPEEHKKVIDDLEWAKENNGIILGLKKFVTTRYWRVIRESRTKTAKPSSDVTII